MIALMAPWVMSLCTKWFSSAFNNGFIVIGEMEITIAPEATGATSFGLMSFIPLIYLLGVGVSASVLAFSYISLVKVIKKGEKIRKDKYIIVVSETEIAPYSWGKYIVVSPEDMDNHLILLHEISHIRCHHSLELLIANLFVVFNWFNPAAYLMRGELSAVQEYEADEKVLQCDVTAKDYQMLLIKKTAGARFQAITNSLNHSQLKNRLTMMMKTKSKTARTLAAALLVPAIIGAAAITSTPAIASVIKSVESTNLSKVSNSEANEQQSDLKVISVQPVTDSTASNSVQEVFEEPEVLPQYKEGEVELYRTLAVNMKYPKDAADAHQQGKVLVKFNVYPDGIASDFEIAQSSEYESLDTEALRVCKENLSTGWTPGKNNGEIVICSFTLPVLFRLQ